MSSQFYAWFTVLVLGAIAMFSGALVVPVADVTIGEAAEETRSDAAGADSAPPQRPAPQTSPKSRSEAEGSAGNANLRINAAGLTIIKESEALRLEAYQLAGQWLIGYGHAATAEPGMVISEAKAEELLRQDLRTTEEGVKRVVTVALNENEFSALVSLAYNLGIGGFQKTVVFERINQGDRMGAADGFLMHDRARIGGELKSLPHLTKRREKERALFLKPV
ncbi:MAG: lysozyme [Pseudomonadota bacterium]